MKKNEKITREVKRKKIDTRGSGCENKGSANKGERKWKMTNPGSAKEGDQGKGKTGPCISLCMCGSIPRDEGGNSTVPCRDRDLALTMATFLLPQKTF